MKMQAFAKVVPRLTMLFFLLSAGLLAAQNRDSAAISKLLNQVKSHAALADDDAATLESLTRTGVHWSTHGTQLDLMKEHVNNLVNDSNEMISLRNEGSPWQQQAIDRIEPLLPVMADHLRNAITHFNGNRNRIHMQAYRDYVVENQKLINSAYQVIKAFDSYAQAMNRADTLQKQLELSHSSTEAENVQP